MTPIFYPYTPADNERLPTVLYFTAGFFSQGQGSPSFLETFLGLALQYGWCVVTAGGVGFDSTPTASQLQRCNLNGGGTNPPPCWDYNLWYPPDSSVSPPSPWNDFNYFYGEKDAVWARQWIARNAATYHMDNTRVVVAGRSTGAIYASFLAFQPNRAWSGASYSSQSRMDTRVAAIVAWDPVVWMEAIPNVPPPNTTVGLHWPRDLSPSAAGNAFRERIPVLTTGLPSEQLASLRSSGPSNFVRQFEPLVPTFVGAGDPILAVFGRNAALVAPDDDYSRSASSSPPNDPTLSFPDDPTPTFLHDLWNTLILKQDLLATDFDYHSRHSRAYLRDSTNWEFIPAALSSSAGSPFPMPPTSHSQVPLVDGVFAGEEGCTGIGLPPNCTALENLSAAQKAVSWMGREVCRDFGPAVQCRNAGINYPVLSFTPAAIGETATAKVLLSECPDEYDAAWVFGFDCPCQIPLTTRDVLLCQDGGAGELLALAAESRPPGGVVQFQVEIPNDPILVGTVLHTQAWLYDYDAVYESALTNAQDLEIQP